MRFCHSLKCRFSTTKREKPSSNLYTGSIFCCKQALLRTIKRNSPRVYGHLIHNIMIKSLDNFFFLLRIKNSESKTRSVYTLDSIFRFVYEKKWMNSQVVKIEVIGCFFRDVRFHVFDRETRKNRIQSKQTTRENTRDSTDVNMN